MTRYFRELPLLLWFAIFSAAASAATPVAPSAASAPAPDWVQPGTVTPPAKWEPNPAGQNYLLLDRQANIATGETYYHRAFQIVSDAGRSDGAQVNINFDPSYQTLTIHHLRLHRGKQALDRFDPAKVQILQREEDLDRQLYNGERSALVILDDVRIGDTVDLAYTLKGRNPVFGENFIDLAYLGWAVPVQELRYRLIQPPGRALHHKIRGDSPGAPVATTTAHGAELLWVRHNLPTIEAEDKTPDWHIVYPFLEITEFANWSAVVTWALPLYTTAAEPTPLLRETLDTIRQSGTTHEARALAALRFVQEEIRYLGIEMGPGSHRPSEPEEVLARRFGDCKDKARLLTALLRHLGLEAAPVLVNSSLRDGIKEWLPSPYAFDHVITALDLNGRRYLLDATMSYQRGDTLALRHVGTYGPALRLAPDTRALEAPRPGESDSYQSDIKETFRTTALDQPTTLTVVTTFRGTSANSMRSWFATRSREQIGREYLDYYTRYYSDLSSTKPVDFADDPALNLVTVTEHYRIKKLFAPTTPNGPLLKAEFYPAVLDDYLRTPNLGQRKSPYALSHPARVSCETTILLPEDWPIENAHQTVRDAAFEFASKINGLGSKIVLHYQWQALAPEIPLARLEEFAAHTTEARNALGYQLTYNTAVSPDSDTYPLNWAMLALGAVVVVAGSVAGWLLVRRRNPMPPAPPLLLSAPPPLQGYSPRPPADLAGLGGWLIPVGFGLFIRPIMLLFYMGTAHRAYFNHAVWQELTTPGTTSYQTHFALIATTELISNLTLLLLSLALLILYFRRSYLFPRTMQVFLAANFLIAIFSTWSNHALTSATPADQQEAIKTLVQAIAAAAIWIPYFQVSRRVKLTFVR